MEHTCNKRPGEPIRPCVDWGGRALKPARARVGQTGGHGELADCDRAVSSSRRSTGYETIDTRNAVSYLSWSEGTSTHQRTGRHPTLPGRTSAEPRREL